MHVMLLQWLCTAAGSGAYNEEYAPLVWPDRDENVLKCHNEQKCKTGHV